MWNDYREEDRVYRVLSARLWCDHRCFCYVMPGRPHLVLVEPLTENLLNFYSNSFGRNIPAYEVTWIFYKTFTGLSNTIALFMPFDFTYWVLPPDELIDVSRGLDPFLSSTPAVGSTRSCSAPNVTPMRPAKRNTLTFTVAVRSIPKCIGSIKIDISKQNMSDQLFEFQTEEGIFALWWLTKFKY